MKVTMNNIKVYIALFFLISLSATAIAQENIIKHDAAEINTQVWEPFKVAFDSFDAEAFNSLHTDDVIRISRGYVWNSIRKSWTNGNAVY